LSNAGVEGIAVERTAPFISVPVLGLPDVSRSDRPQRWSNRQ
jgi:hypothetical protein